MKFSLFAISIVLSIVSYSCKNYGFKKGVGGMEYRTVIQGEGPDADNGAWLKLHLQQRYNDSLLRDTRTSMPAYLRLDSVSMSPASYQVFEHVSVGDSIVFRVMEDSAFSKPKPPFAKGKGWLVTTVKVEAIFPTENLMQRDRQSLLPPDRRSQLPQDGRPQFPSRNMENGQSQFPQEGQQQEFPHGDH
jgi:hypothetical protein